MKALLILALLLCGCGHKESACIMGVKFSRPLNSNGIWEQVEPLVQCAPPDAYAKP
jgi:hypothetical protein